VGESLDGVTIRGPSLLKTVDPAPSELVGRRIAGVERLGKRIVLEHEGELFSVLHLMIAGRLQWKNRGVGAGGRTVLAAWSFSSGTLVLTEASSKKRASLWIVRGRDALDAHDPGGIDVLEAS
jgi:formamidopyrimidine-DNA glycosylase